MNLSVGGIRYGERFEIVAELDEFYFLWAHGTMIAFPKYGKYVYDIETEIVNTE